ncbi:MAG: EamA/RhaT family transporter, partial [Paracoccus sp. (in: a-proteobacteria)]
MPASARNTSRDRIPLAVFAIILTVLALSLGDALIKMTSGSFVIWQIFVVRSLILLPVLVILALSLGRLHRPEAFSWIALRSLMLIA